MKNGVGLQFRSLNLLLDVRFLKEDNAALCEYTRKLQLSRRGQSVIRFRVRLICVRWHFGAVHLRLDASVSD